MCLPDAHSTHHGSKDEGRDEADEGRQAAVDEAEDHHDDREGHVVVGTRDHRHGNGGSSRLTHHHHVLHVQWIGNTFSGNF